MKTPMDRVRELFTHTVISIYGPECMACEINTMQPQVDHIFPQSIWKARRFDPDNAQVLCPDCNRIKGTSVVDYRPDDDDARRANLRIEWCEVITRYCFDLQHRVDLAKRLSDARSLT